MSDWLNQQSMFEQDDTMRAIVGLMEKHKRSATKLTAALNNMLDQVEDAGNPSQMSLLGDENLPTRGEIIQKAQETVAAEGTRFSLRTLPDGTKYTLVEAKEIIYDGVKEEYTMSRKAREYMKKHFILFVFQIIKYRARIASSAFQASSQ